MKNPKFKESLFYIIPFYILSFCALSGLLILFSASAAFSSDMTMTLKVKKATTKLDKTTQMEAIIPLPKDIVKATMDYQGGNFFTEERKSKIQRFQCTSCHNNKPISINNAGKISHDDIKIDHGDKEGPLSCNTCHYENDRDFLVTSKGSKIDMDHVYDMCGQCHFRQKKDWIGGAHGKRITYWAGERVVKNCTSCHNPHSPLFKKRWPKTYSVPLK
jgi:hypothetical protein